MEPKRRERKVSKKKMLMKLARKYWFVGAAALGLVLAVVLGIGLITGLNKYKEPVKLEQKAYNAKTPDDMMDASLEQLNGLCEKEMKTIMKLMKDTDEYGYLTDNYIYFISNLTDNAGENYKVKIKTTDKEKLDEDVLETMQLHIELLAQQFLDRADHLEENKSDFEDKWDLSSKDMDKLIKAYRKIGKTLEKAKVTKGYELELEMKIKGSLLDEPTEATRSCKIYKIGGKWVSADALDTLHIF